MILKQRLYAAKVFSRFLIFSYTKKIHQNFCNYPVGPMKAYHRQLKLLNCRQGKLNVHVCSSQHRPRPNLQEEHLNLRNIVKLLQKILLILFVSVVAMQRTMICFFFYFYRMLVRVTCKDKNAEVKKKRRTRNPKNLTYSNYVSNLLYYVFALLILYLFQP